MKPWPPAAGDADRVAAVAQLRADLDEAVDLGDQPRRLRPRAPRRRRGSTRGRPGPRRRRSAGRRRGPPVDRERVAVAAGAAAGRRAPARPGAREPAATGAGSTTDAGAAPGHAAGVGGSARRAAVGRRARAATIARHDGTARAQATRATPPRPGAARPAAHGRREAGRGRQGAAHHRHVRVRRAPRALLRRALDLPECGATYDTGRVPRGAVRAIRRVQRRFRAVPIALGAPRRRAGIFFTLTGNSFGVFFLLPLGAATWFAFIRPLHRRRYRAAIADLPRWDLRAE